MKTWTGAGDRLRERRFLEIAEEAVSAAPIAYNFVTYRTELPTFLESLLVDDPALSEEVVELTTKRASYVTEALTAFSKFYHVLACASVSMEKGALTWSTVDAYHASLFGARAILAAYGVVPFTLRGKSILVDLWPEFGRVDQRRAFRKNHGKSDDLIRVLAPTAQMHQGDLWRLLERLTNIADKVDPERGEQFRHLREVINEKPWQSRHANLYDASSWTWPDDIAFLTASRAEKSAKLLTDDRAIASLMEMLDVQFDILSTLEGELRKLTALPSIQMPAIARSARTPTVLCNW